MIIFPGQENDKNLCIPHFSVEKREGLLDSPNRRLSFSMANALKQAEKIGLDMLQYAAYGACVDLESNAITFYGMTMRKVGSALPLHVPPYSLTKKQSFSMSSFPLSRRLYMDVTSDVMTAAVIIHRIAKQIESHISEICRLLGLLSNGSSADEQVSESDSFVVSVHRVPTMLSLTRILRCLNQHRPGQVIQARRLL